MCACTSGSPAMAPAGLSLSLLLLATFLFPSSVTSESSAPAVAPKPLIRQPPLLPSQQELQSLEFAPAAYDLALLNNDDLSAFEEESAIEKHSKLKDKITSSENDVSDMNDEDYPNYYDSDKTQTVDYDAYEPDPNYDSGSNNNKVTIPIYPLTNKNEYNSVLHDFEDNRIEANYNDDFTDFNLKDENKEPALNKVESNYYENGNVELDEYELKQRNQIDKLKELDKDDIESSNAMSSVDYQTLNEDYAQRDDTAGDRKKRESESNMNKTKPRGVTGDTVLNIAGAVRDTIAERAPPFPPASPSPPSPPGLPPSRVPATRLDAVVIRTAASELPPLLLSHAHTEDEQVSVEEKGVVTATVGARVELPCDAPATGGRAVWTRDNEIVPGVSVSSAGTLSLRAARGAAGTWRCMRDAASSPAVTLRIYERTGAAWLRVEGRRLDAGRAWLPAREGTTVTLACHADGGVPPPVLVWRVNPPSPLLTYNRTTYQDGVATSWASVVAHRDLHNATVTCEPIQREPTYSLEGEEGRTGDMGEELTAAVMLQVTFPPTFSISRRPGFGRPLVSGRSAALRCDVSANPRPRAAWTRGDEPLPAALQSSGSGWAEARWLSLSRSHTGWYRCTCEWLGTHYSSIGYLLTVQEADAEAGPTDPQRCPGGSGACRRPIASEPRAAGSRPDNVVPSGAAVASAIRVESVSGGGEEEGEEGEEGEQRERQVEDGVQTAAWRRVTCAVCGVEVRARWLRGDVVSRAELTASPSSSPSSSSSSSSSSPHTHCRIASTTAPAHQEVWCIAVNEAGGSVAVFPPTAPPPPPPPVPHPAFPRALSHACPLSPTHIASTTLPLLTILAKYRHFITAL